MSWVCPVFWVSGGRVFMKVDNGWLDLGEEKEVLDLDPPARVALAKARIREPRWHEVPPKRRLM